MNHSKITFSFGKNWRHYVKTIDKTSIQNSQNAILIWISHAKIQGKTVLDIGCGSGLHSLNFYHLGAKKIVSFDSDKRSVNATQYLWGKFGKPHNWMIMQGSVLDEIFLQSLGKFDLVYSWGVLHHTGSMWKAIENASRLVDNKGLFLISIYQGASTYEQDLALKQKYNNASALGKKIIIYKEIYALMKELYQQGRNPFMWNDKRKRGMDTYHDLVDWLGGLPYEVASKEQVSQFLETKNFRLLKFNDKQACITYLFSSIHDL